MRPENEAMQTVRFGILQTENSPNPRILHKFCNEGCFEPLPPRECFEKFLMLCFLGHGETTNIPLTMLPSFNVKITHKSTGRCAKTPGEQARFGNGPKTVLESMVSNTSEFLALTEFRGVSSVSSSQPIIRVQKQTHRDFRRIH